MPLPAMLGAILIGLTLGLTGAGGSIITLPVLVYLAGIPPAEAVGMSLFIVGSAALAGAVQRYRAGEFHVKAALLYALTGIPGAAIGAQFTSLVPSSVLMTSFGILMVIVAGNLLLRPTKETSQEGDCCILSCALTGVGVGFLTGFIGVGGGFLLMPALVKFAHLPLRLATGTSLAIIAFNSAAGFLTHFSSTPTRWGLTLLFSGIAIAGTLLGHHFSKNLPTARLSQIFSFLVLSTGTYVIFQSCRG